MAYAALWLTISTGLLQPVSAEGAGAFYVYDAGGRLIGVIAPDGSNAKYAYDAAGNQLSVTRTAAGTLAAVGFSNTSGTPGSTVTIYGGGFSTTASCNQVSFNGVSATVSSSTATSLSVVVPSAATSGTVAITECAGGSVTTSAFTVTPGYQFPVVSGVSPNIGASGASLAISGSGFQTTPNKNRVVINSASAAVTAAAAGSVTVTIPNGATSGRLIFSTPYGTASNQPDVFVPPSPYVASNVATAQRKAPDGNAAQVNITTAGQIGMFLFDGTAGQRISAVLPTSTLTNCSSGTLTVVDSSGTKLGTSGACSPNGGGGVGPFVLPATGEYTALVLPYSSSTGAFSFALYSVPPDSITPLPLDGTDKTISITVPGQAADFTFTGTAGKRVSFYTKNDTLNSTSGGFTFYVANPDGTYLYAPQSEVSGTLFYGPFILPQSGTYKVVVAPASLATGSITVNAYNVVDTSASIATDGTATTVTTTGRGQAANLTFTGSANQRVSLRLSSDTFSSSYGSYTVSLVNPDGTVVFGPTTENSGSIFFGPYTLTQNGIYKIVIQPAADGAGSLTVNLYNVPANATYSAPTDGTSTTVTLSTPGQSGIVSFSGTTGQRVSFTTSNDTFPNSGLFYFSILNPDGSAIVNQLGETAGWINVYTLTQTGTYKVVIQQFSGGTGSVSLNIFNVPPDTSAVASADGTATTVTLGTPGQSGAISFSATAGQRVSFTTSNDTFPSSGVFYFSLLNPDGTSIVNQQGESAGWVGIYTLAQTGTYKVVIKEYQGNTGSVAVTIFNVPSDTTATTTTDGTPATVTLGTPGQSGSLQFSATAGQRLSFLTSSDTLSSSGRFYFSIFNPDGTAILNQQLETSGWIGIYTVAQSGTYRAVIQPYNGGTGSAALKIFNVPPDTSAPIVINGASVTATLGTPGQAANLTFSCTAGHTLTAAFSSSTFASYYNVTILNPDGSAILALTATNGSHTYGAYSMAQSGTCTVRVGPYYGSTGSVTVKLTGN